MKKTVILFQGDSITDGGRLKDPNRAWDLNHQMGHCYAYNIASFLGARYPERNYEFINRGISGNRVADLYGRWKEDALGFRPDILRFELWNSVIQPLQEKVMCLAERNGAVFVPLQDKFNELCKVREPEYWVWDGIHPTVAGHQVIADQWMTCAKDIIECAYQKGDVDCG